HLPDLAVAARRVLAARAARAGALSAGLADPAAVSPARLRGRGRARLPARHPDPARTPAARSERGSQLTWAPRIRAPSPFSRSGSETEPTMPRSSPTSRRPG